MTQLLFEEADAERHRRSATQFVKQEAGQAVFARQRGAVGRIGNVVEFARQGETARDGGTLPCGLVT